MSLIRCPDCGREVSAMAPACPGCGRPTAAQAQAGVVIAKPHWTQDRNLGCLGACIIFLVLPALALM